MKHQKHLFCFLISVIFFSNSLFAQSAIPDKLDGLLKDSLFESSQISVNIYDLTAKEPVYEKNIKLLFHPASNMKILTTAAGLYFLGPDYEFTTSLFHTGKIKNKILKGDLYIAGGGDPDFTTSDLDSLIRLLKAAGIKRIRGNICADLTFVDSLFWGKGWMWDDDPSTDAPYLSALNLNKNSALVIIEPGKPGKRAMVKTIPKTKFFKIINKSLTVDNDTSDLACYRDWIDRTNNIIVKGRLSKNAALEKNEINVYNPAMYFLTLFKEKLKENKIYFGGKLKFTHLPPQIADSLFSLRRPFGQVIMGLNKNSDNLSAEMTLRALSVKYFGKPAAADSGIKMVDSLITLAGLNYKSYRIVDGSGVSHYNLVNTELLLGVLKFIYNSKPELFNILYNSFPVAGVDGTLRNRMKFSAANNNVHAKTGTISGVSCLSGYVTARNNHMLAFSVMIQNYVDTSSKAVNIQDEICRVLAE